MKKLFYALGILLFMSLHLGAQSFNYEDVTVKYKLVAKTPFTSAFGTITVRFLGDEHLKRYGILPSELISSEYKFERFKNVPEHGDLHLDVSVGKPEYLGVEKATEKRKEKDGEVTYYYYQGTVITPITYELRDGARNLIDEKIVFNATDHLHFTTEAYASSYALAKAWEEGQNIVISKNVAEILRNSLAETSKKIKDRFDDQILQKKLNLFDIKKADKIHAEFLNTAFLKITSGLAQNQNISSWPESQKSEIKELLSRGTKFGTEDNDERVAYAIAYFNLAALNAFWNDIATAKSCILKGKKADRKIWEFEQLEKWIAEMDHRGEADEISAKEYVSTYQDGADAKLPGMPVSTQTGSVTEDFTPSKARTIDTVYAMNGDIIIGYVTVVHKMRRLGTDEIHDLTHLIINPLNMPQDEIKLPVSELKLLVHKGIYMKPLPTKIALALDPPIHLYEPLKVSKNGKVALLRTAYHESMPYNLSSMEGRAYLYIVRPKNDSPDFDILPVSGGSRYLLGLNGALSKDFETCSTIVAKTKVKHYELTEESLKGLIDDYDTCSSK